MGQRRGQVALSRPLTVGRRRTDPQRIGRCFYQGGATIRAQAGTAGFQSLAPGPPRSRGRRLTPNWQAIRSRPPPVPAGAGSGWHPATPWPAQAPHVLILPGPHHRRPDLLHWPGKAQARQLGSLNAAIRRDLVQFRIRLLKNPMTAGRSNQTTGRTILATVLSTPRSPTSIRRSARRQAVLFSPARRWPVLPMPRPDPATRNAAAAVGQGNRRSHPAPEPVPDAPPRQATFARRPATVPQRRHPSSPLWRSEPSRRCDLRRQGACRRVNASSRRHLQRDEGPVLALSWGLRVWGRGSTAGRIQ